ncbi:vanadium-dependent haloperoxidase [Marinoscillum furvescens]|uniref:PAP2 superfamily protein n=1 Tax=Marinoscillum furvescens DSM 4134 TaxID=1122208 RepID=A0A3D9KXH8_MARFU|nr:vanadium-dependent haloperoxidase [Marinoscillum furvescens]RED93618.1 PAP2 superfamily protein [Marinoscillum furvescens DSM 4134]
MKKYVLLTLLGALTLGACTENTAYRKVLQDPETYQTAMKQLTDVIVYDIFSPPVASRVYVYPNIAAYEVLAHAKKDTLLSLGGQLTDFITPPAPTEEIDPYLASLHAFLTVGKTLIFSEEKIDAFRENLYERLEDQGLSSSLKNRSLAYGELVAKHILDWADGDMYKQTRTYPKYTVRSETFAWKPTPPDYMEGIEPHWNKIRPMVLDSANQYPPVPPLELTMEEGSEFHNQLLEVYEFGSGKTEEHKAIAKFWDCNPYVSHHRGHAMFATKKITPGGHWMGIVAIASRKANSDFAETVEAFTRTSIALFDGFISCWDEKWRSIVVRPETLINQYMDEEWTPLLQTPPFPEYTSGHSVISRAAAVTLTYYYGDNFAFNDTTEMEYGLPERSFNSFLEASEEAAISRLYGGIHYMMAIENGVSQGEKVGEHVVANIRTRKNESLATK